MNLPNIPTDNMYKFLAISGLIILIASSIGTMVMLRNINQEDIAIEKASTALQADISLLEFQAQSVKDNISQVKEDLNNGLITYEQAQEQMKPLLAQNGELYLNLTNLESKAITDSEVQSVKDDLTFAMLINRTGFIEGTLFTIWGFWMWYWKLQRHLDKIVANKSKSK